MKLYVWLFILFMQLSVFGQENDSVNEKNGSFQIELSGMGFKLYDVLHLHANMGVNIPTRKKGWYNNLALSVNKSDWAQNGGGVMNFYSLSIGRHYQIIHKRFFCSAGLNFGGFYHDWFSGAQPRSSRTLGINIIPRLDVGVSTKKTIISTGFYFTVGAGFYEEYYMGKVDESPLWYRINGAASPYVRIIIRK